MTCVDSNVLLDLVQAQADWLAWSRDRLATCAAVGPLLVNDVVFAEISVSFATVLEVERFLAAAGVSVERSSTASLFLAARAHLDYRRRGGSRLGVLPDFFIGADAMSRGAPLLTRDPRRYRGYFPDLRLISP